MAKAHINGLMVDFTMVSTNKIRNMALVYMYGQMAELILEIGLKESKLMKESIFCQMVQSERDFGRMVKEKNGKKFQKKKAKSTKTNLMR